MADTTHNVFDLELRNYWVTLTRMGFKERGYLTVFDPDKLVGSNPPSPQYLMMSRLSPANSEKQASNCKTEDKLLVHLLVVLFASVLHGLF